MSHPIKRTFIMLLCVVAPSVGFAPVANASKLDPDSAPGSTMKTLNEIYDKLEEIRLALVALTNASQGEEN